MLSRTNGWMVATLLSLALIGACAGSGPIDDSPEAREQLARKIVRLEIENGDLDLRLDRGADLAQAYSLDMLRLELGREFEKQEAARVRKIMRSVLGEFLTPEIWEGVLTEVYADHFTAPELKAILEFFESSAGSKILRLNIQLTEEIDAKSDVVFEGQLDAFANRVDEELGKAFPALQEGGS